MASFEAVPLAPANLQMIFSRRITYISVAGVVCCARRASRIDCLVNAPQPPASCLAPRSKSLFCHPLELRARMLSFTAIVTYYYLHLLLTPPCMCCAIRSFYRASSPCRVLQLELRIFTLMFMLIIDVTVFTKFYIN